MTQRRESRPPVQLFDVQPAKTGVKVCAICGVEKPVAEFYWHRRRADGLDTRCRACCRLHKRKRDNAPRLADVLRMAKQHGFDVRLKIDGHDVLLTKGGAKP
jgi:hypothetical protein